jgi:hypothetical protein
MHMVEFKATKSLATKFCVAVMTFAIGFAVHLILSAAPPPSLPPSPPARQQPVAVDYSNAEPGTLRWRIGDAKAKGETRVRLGGIGCGIDIGSLRTALSRDTVVVAELVGKKTYEDLYGLHTWYRFKTKETLVEHPYPKGLKFDSAPSDMLPIAEDEFLLQEINGEMEIDGITVTQISNGVKYSEGQTYLLFVWIDPSKRTAVRAGTDALGVFRVDSDGNLSSLVKEDYQLKNQVEKRFKNSLDNFRQAVKK